MLPLWAVDKLPAVITSSIICKFVCANVPSGAVAAVPAVSWVSLLPVVGVTVVSCITWACYCC